MTFQNVTMRPSDLPVEAKPADARDWIKILSAYRAPNLLRSLWELAASVVPFLTIWVLAYAALQVWVPLAIALAVFNGMFLLRLFAIQHDCGHGAYLTNRQASDWIGRTLGVLTLTPYTVWKRAHAIHHSHSGNLDTRGIGDVDTLTVAEYQALTPWGRFTYRLYRHPFVMFGIGPAYLFFLKHRLPFGLMSAGRQYWISAMGTNLVALALWVGLYMIGGWQLLVFVYVPTTLTAASVGVWLFYVQHQFETTHWDGEADWQLHEAALHGSSHYDLPVVLRWLTANIGIHHVHHMYSRIPFYRLTEVLRDHKELVESSRLTLRDSWACAHLDLWCTETRRLVSFRSLRAQMA